MEINPITAIRPVPMVKPSNVAPDLSRVFEAEYLGQSADDAYTPSHKKASRGLEDEEDGTELEDLVEESAPAEFAASTKVSFFA
jgi:hypothetical protein